MADAVEAQAGVARMVMGMERAALERRGKGDPSVFLGISGLALVACLALACRPTPRAEALPDCRTRAVASGREYYAALEVCLRDRHRWTTGDASLAVGKERLHFKLAEMSVDERASYWRALRGSFARAGLKASYVDSVIQADSQEFGVLDSIELAVRRRIAGQQTPPD
jgi:hypothetical protein